LFWVAHAKLQKKLINMISMLMNCMAIETKEVGQRRAIMKNQIINEYQARKDRYPKKIPKFIKATNVNLDH
jgi:hypothetical protein